MGDANIETVQRIYEAFGRGDVESILAWVGDDVDWGSEPESNVAPWHPQWNPEPVKVTGQHACVQAEDTAAALPGAVW